MLKTSPGIVQRLRHPRQSMEPERTREPDIGTQASMKEVNYRTPDHALRAVAPHKKK